MRVIIYIYILTSKIFWMYSYFFEAKLYSYDSFAIKSASIFHRKSLRCVKWKAYFIEAVLKSNWLWVTGRKKRIKKKAIFQQRVPNLDKFQKSLSKLEKCKSYFKNFDLFCKLPIGQLRRVPPKWVGNVREAWNLYATALQSDPKTSFLQTSSQKYVALPHFDC